MLRKVILILNNREIYRTWKLIIVIIILSSTIVGCSYQVEQRAIEVDLGTRSNSQARQLSTAEDQNVIYFGFDRRLEPKEDVKMYVPLLSYLEQETGYQFKVHVTNVNSSVVDELGQGKIQMAAIGTLGYLQAREEYGVLITVRGLNLENEDKYRAAIVARPNSSIETINDINGRTFAFGDPTSTQGHLIPMMMLSQKGIELNSLNYYQYYSSHSEVANAVMSGRFDAGGMQDTLAQSLESQGLLKIVAVSEEFPSSGIAFAPDVNKEQIAKITEALLNFEPKGKDSANLYHWDSSEMPNGFTNAGDEDYNILRIWADQFGLLTETEGLNQ